MNVIQAQGGTRPHLPGNFANSRLQGVMGDYQPTKRLGTQGRQRCNITTVVERARLKSRPQRRSIALFTVCTHLQSDCIRLRLHFPH